jgi:hypothetical protein
MPSHHDPDEVTPNRELCRRWLKCIETLLPPKLDTAEKKGGMTVAYLGQKPLPDGRVVEFSLKARVDQDSGRARKKR